MRDPPRRRADVRAYRARLPGLPVAVHDDVITLVERRKLASSGIGWVDARLLASALLASVPLWTLDRTLQQVSVRLGVSSRPALNPF